MCTHCLKDSICLPARHLHIWQQIFGAPAPLPVAAGMVNGECFAQDYMLASRSQCSYTLGEGTCPDAALSGDPATNQVELVLCEQVRGLPLLPIWTEQRE